MNVSRTNAPPGFYRQNAAPQEGRRQSKPDIPPSNNKSHQCLFDKNRPGLALFGKYRTGYRASEVDPTTSKLQSDPGEPGSGGTYFIDANFDEKESYQAKALYTIETISNLFTGDTTFFPF